MPSLRRTMYELTTSVRKALLNPRIGRYLRLGRIALALLEPAIPSEATNELADLFNYKVDNRSPIIVDMPFPLTRFFREMYHSSEMAELATLLLYCTSWAETSVS